eukprot:330382-Pyramimonas_sp.AAC.1
MEFQDYKLQANGQVTDAADPGGEVQRQARLSVTERDTRETATPPRGSGPRGGHALRHAAGVLRHALEPAARGDEAVPLRARRRRARDPLPHADRR